MLLSCVALVGRPRFGQQGPIEALAVSPDGQTLVAGGGSETIVWSLPDRRRVRRLPTGRVEAITWLDADTVAVTALSETTFYSAFTWTQLLRISECVSTFARPRGEVVRVALRAAHGGVEVRDVFLRRPREREASWRLVRTFAHQADPSLSPDGQTVTLGGQSFDVTTGRPREAVLTPRNQLRAPCEATAVAPTREGGLVVGTRGGDLRVFDRSGREAAPAEPAITAAAFAPDGELAVGDAEGTIRLLDSSYRVVRRVRAHHGAVRSIAFSSDGDRIASSGCDRKVRLASRTSSDEVLLLETGRQVVERVVFAPDGGTLALSGLAALWDLRTLGLREAGVEDPVRSVAWSLDGSIVAFATRGGAVRLWDHRSGAPTGEIESDARVRDVAFHPSGERLAVAFEDRPSAVYSRGGRQLLDLPPARAVAFSPTGEVIACAAEGITLTCESTGRELARASHDVDVEAVTFGPGGQLLSIEDGAARVWRLT